MDKRPLRKILHSVAVAPDCYLAVTDDGLAFVIEWAGDHDGWRWYHAEDNPNAFQQASESGYFSYQDCMAGLRDYLSHLVLPPRMIITQVQHVISA